MGKSLIQTTNQTAQTVAANGIINLGSVLRRYGCNLKLSGNAIEAVGEGYYDIDVTVSVAPTAAGPVTIAVYNNGVQIPSAITYDTGTAGDPVSACISTTIRQGCRCTDADRLTVVLVAGAGTVQNVGVRVVKQ